MIESNERARARRYQNANHPVARSLHSVLELKLRQPIADTGDRYQESLRTIQVAMDRGAEHTVGPLDRQISRPRKDALADGLSVNEESYNTANTLSIDSLVSIDPL